MEETKSFNINNKRCFLHKKENLYGLINEEKATVIPCNFTYIEDLKGVAFLVIHKQTFLERIFKKFKFQVFNVDGKAITPIYPNNNFDILGNYSGELNKQTLLVKNSNNKFGIFDLEGNQRVDFIYDAIEFRHPYNNFGSVQAKYNGKWGIIDSFGQTLLEFKYDYIGKFPYQDFSNNLIPIIQNGNWGLIDEEYKIIIPAIYSNDWFKQNKSFIKFTDDKLLAAQFEGKYGFINNKNEVKIPFIFDDALNFENGIAHVTLNGEKGSIDKEGKKYW